MIENIKLIDIRARAAAILLLLALAGCEAEGLEGAVTGLPEVNDENCRRENIAKMSPDDVREEFASMCLRRSGYKPSEPKAW